MPQDLHHTIYDLLSLNAILHILHLLEQWQAEASNVVMVGDYLFDLQAGKAAGAITIHMARPDGQRWPDYSDIMIDSLAELAEMLKQS